MRTSEFVLVNLAIGFLSITSVWQDFKSRLPDLARPSKLDMMLEDLTLSNLQKECLSLLRDSSRNPDIVQRARILLNIKSLEQKQPKVRMSQYSIEFANVLGLESTLILEGNIKGGLLNNLPNVAVIGIEKVSSLSELRELLWNISNRESPLFTRDDGELIEYFDNLRKLCVAELKDWESQDAKTAFSESEVKFIREKLIQCVRNEMFNDHN